MPTERTNTAVVQTRVDIRILAGLAQYAAKQGRSPKDVQGFSKSNLVCSCLELLHDSLFVSQVLEKVDSSAEALGILQELGYGMENSVNKVKLQAAIELESFQAVELLSKPGADSAARRALSESD